MTIVYCNTPLESLFHGACWQGDLELVKKLTTSSSKDVLDINSAFNYGLRVAASNGHLDVLDYLVHYPDAKRRKEIIKDISSAISSASDKGELKSLLYFKKHFPQKYNKLLNARTINHTLDLLSMSGKLEAIKYFVLEAHGLDGITWDLFIEKSIQYDKKNCFDFFVKTTPSQYLQNLSPTKRQDILHTCLYNERFDCLPVLVKYIDFKEDLTVNHFNILLETKIQSLYHIIVEYDYRPSEELQSQINDYLANNKDIFSKKLNKLITAINNNEFNNKLSSELKEKNKNKKNHKI